jgi:hypothetical protein
MNRNYNFKTRVRRSICTPQSLDMNLIHFILLVSFTMDFILLKMNITDWMPSAKEDKAG